MKKLIALFLFALSFQALAYTMVGNGDFATASNVAIASDIQCTGKQTTDTLGNPQVAISDCVVRTAVIQFGTTMNFCYRFTSYDLFSAALNKTVSLYDLAYNTKSMPWSWFPAFQPPPAGIDPRCLQ